MRFAVNGWRAEGHRTGIARYLLNVVRRWNHELIDGRFEGGAFYAAREMDLEELSLPAGLDFRVLPSDRPMLVWENTRFAAAAGEAVAFHPSFSIPLVRRGRTVVTTHDLVMEKHPELFSSQQRRLYNRLYRWSARHATLVITDSQASCQDMMALWGVPEERIRVIYLAPDAVFGPRPGDPAVQEAHRRLVGSDAPFVMFVGKLTGRRNIPLMLEAFAEVRRRHPGLDQRLLVIGKDLHGLDVRGLAVRFGIEHHVVHHDQVSDEDLVSLYCAAQAYVMPAGYETTGLPILEAQVSGTPVITVDTAGMREVTGEAALLVDRLEVRDFADGLERMMTDPDLRERLVADGARSVARFTWDRSAAATLDVLHEAATLPRRWPSGLR